MGLEEISIITLGNIRELQHHESLIIRRRLSNGNTRPRYKLENDLTVLISNGDTITIPKGFEWDLSSVPRFLWGLLPPDGLFEFSSIIHDWLYVNKLYSRKFADDEMLKWSKATAGTLNKVSLRNFDNQVRYVSVRLFGWLVWNKRKKGLT